MYTVVGTDSFGRFEVDDEADESTCKIDGGKLGHDIETLATETSTLVAQSQETCDNAYY